MLKCPRTLCFLHIRALCAVGRVDYKLMGHLLQREFCIFCTRWSNYVLLDPTVLGSIQRGKNESTPVSGQIIAGDVRSRMPPPLTAPAFCACSI